MVKNTEQDWISKHPIYAIIIFFLGLCLLFSGFYGHETSKERTDSYVPMVQNTHTTFVEETKKDFCGSLIPDRIKLVRWTNEISNEEVWSHSGMNGAQFEETKDDVFAWNDGAVLKDQTELFFIKGRQEGENVAYAYSHSTRGFLIYENQPIGSNGVVGKKISYSIMIGIDPNDKNEEGYKTKEYKCCKNSEYNYCYVKYESYKTL